MLSFGFGQNSTLPRDFICFEEDLSLFSFGIDPGWGLQSPSIENRHEKTHLGMTKVQVISQKQAKRGDAQILEGGKNGGKDDDEKDRPSASSWVLFSV